MATEKSPAFQFYPKDFLTDSHVVGMTLAERGAYITLLCLCWMDQSLPVDLAALARLCGVAAAVFTKIWPALEPCFTVVDGRLVQPRIERERRKQGDYRRRQRDAAAMRWDKLASPKPSAEPMPEPCDPYPKPMPLACSSVFSLQSASPERAGGRPPAPAPAEARSKRPLFTGQRLTVHEWMLDELVRLLGRHADAFDLHAWFFTLDARCAATDLIPPARDNGAWLKAECLAEAQRRGLPLKVATAAPAPPDPEALARATARDLGLDVHKP